MNLDGLNTEFLRAIGRRLQYWDGRLTFQGCFNDEERKQRLLLAWEKVKKERAYASVENVFCSDYMVTDPNILKQKPRLVRLFLRNNGVAWWADYDGGSLEDPLMRSMTGGFQTGISGNERF